MNLKEYYATLFELEKLDGEVQSLALNIARMKQQRDTAASRKDQLLAKIKQAEQQIVKGE